MWIISNKQLDGISKSMREEFEKRAYYILSKEECTIGLDAQKIRKNINEQMDRLIESKITDEDLALNHIRLSFKYPALEDAQSKIEL